MGRFGQGRLRGLVSAGSNSRVARSAEEGRDIILMMLLVGVIFVGFALIADLWNWRSRKRHNARH